MQLYDKIGYEIGCCSLYLEIIFLWLPFIHLSGDIKTRKSPLRVQQNAQAIAGTQSPVVRRPISANPGLNFNLRFFIPLLKSLFVKIFSVLFKASSSHTLNKKNSTEFSCKAFRSEIGFHTNPGLS